MIYVKNVLLRRENAREKRNSKAGHDIVLEAGPQQAINGRRRDEIILACVEHFEISKAM